MSNRNRATPTQVCGLIALAKERGWERKDDAEDFIELISPVGATGDWAIITIDQPATRPSVRTLQRWHKDRDPDRGYFAASYILAADQQHRFKNTQPK